MFRKNETVTEIFAILMYELPEIKDQLVEVFKIIPPDKRVRRSYIHIPPKSVIKVAQ